MVEKTHTTGLWPSLYDPFRSVGARVADWFAPASEASVRDEGYRIALELPGVAEKDISVTVEDGVLTVKGEKRSESEQSGDSWYFSERQYGSFSRSFRLPPEADPGLVSAALKDGVLTLSVGRKDPTRGRGATEIPISSG
ncbi:MULTISPECIES: Hsp20/alpha crystallin family protein [Actibacterium]|uniref:HSP20 family protein n=1 Tax=Actibacterium naphthalenivorans TaxID=1614693 RepID=A0A840CEU6_9RHOB|nr:MULTISPECIES: Hsp20/alpha crystallin family protein [Actibacterium]ALG89601.1 glutamyl-tRNA amidotransferase [Actibacterium sp. EMB200-NS6]MBB4020737.1 HSP20 family protein [Actibacterium naphthalenivorans]